MAVVMSFFLAMCRRKQSLLSCCCAGECTVGVLFGLGLVDGWVVGSLVPARMS